MKNVPFLLIFNLLPSRQQEAEEEEKKEKEKEI